MGVKKFLIVKIGKESRVLKQIPIKTLNYRVSDGLQLLSKAKPAALIQRM